MPSWIDMQRESIAEVLDQLFISYDLQVSRLGLLVFYYHTRVDFPCQNGNLFSHGRALSCDINGCVAMLFSIQSKAKICSHIQGAR